MALLGDIFKQASDQVQEFFGGNEQPSEKNKQQRTQQDNQTTLPKNLSNLGDVTKDPTVQKVINQAQKQDGGGSFNNLVSEVGEQASALGTIFKRGVKEIGQEISERQSDVTSDQLLTGSVAGAVTGETSEEIQTRARMQELGPGGKRALEVKGVSAEDLGVESDKKNQTSQRNQTPIPSATLEKLKQNQTPIPSATLEELKQNQTPIPSATLEELKQDQTPIPSPSEGQQNQEDGGARAVPNFQIPESAKTSSPPTLDLQENKITKFPGRNTIASSPNTGGRGESGLSVPSELQINPDDPIEVKREKLEKQEQIFTGKQPTEFGGTEITKTGQRGTTGTSSPTGGGGGRGSFRGFQTQASAVTRGEEDEDGNKDISEIRKRAKENISDFLDKGALVFNNKTGKFELGDVSETAFQQNPELFKQAVREANRLTTDITGGQRFTIESPLSKKGTIKLEGGETVDLAKRLSEATQGKTPQDVENQIAVFQSLFRQREESVNPTPPNPTDTKKQTAQNQQQLQQLQQTPTQLFNSLQQRFQIPQTKKKVIKRMKDLRAANAAVNKLTKQIQKDPDFPAELAEKRVERIQQKFQPRIDSIRSEINILQEQLSQRRQAFREKLGFVQKRRENIRERRQDIRERRQEQLEQQRKRQRQQQALSLLQQGAKPATVANQTGISLSDLENAQQAVQKAQSQKEFDLRNIEGVGTVQIERNEQGRVIDSKVIFKERKQETDVNAPTIFGLTDQEAADVVVRDTPPAWFRKRLRNNPDFRQQVERKTNVPLKNFTEQDWNNAWTGFKNQMIENTKKLRNRLSGGQTFGLEIGGGISPGKSIDKALGN